MYYWNANCENCFYRQQEAMETDRRWSPWRVIPGRVTSGLGVSSWAPNRLDLFARGTNRELTHRWRQNSRWSNWESLGGILTSSPSAVSWGPNRIDVVVRGTDNAMYHKWWDGSRWNDWESLGGILTSAPSIC
ncbi:carbohydrate-binding protein, partial [Coprococcus sp. MSK.21.13]|nr:carbohydrate-binding protein [Coprococcus sp. MSK.21.13]